MKRKKFIPVICAALLCFSAGGLPFGRAEPPAAIKASAATTVDSGSCGDNATYTLDSDGLLTIIGTGEIKERTFEFYSYSYPLKIKSVVIEEGITIVNSYAFNCCTNIKSVTLPKSITNIGYDAFYGCSSAENVYCPVDPEGLEWIDSYDDFGSSTQFHVPSNCKTDYENKFSFQGKFAGDLEEVPKFTRIPYTAPTCKTPGNKEYYQYSVDNKYYWTKDNSESNRIDDLDETILPADSNLHKFGEWTKNADGKVVRTCTLCNKTEESSFDSNEPTYVITIPASVEFDSSGKASAYMDIRYYGIDISTYTNQPFSNQDILVTLTSVNNLAIGNDTKYILSDTDHNVDAEYSLSVENTDGEPFDPLKNPSSALVKGCIDTGSNYYVEDSATLIFDGKDFSDLPMGDYKGTLTFTISLTSRMINFDYDRRIYV